MPIRSGCTFSESFGHSVSGKKMVFWSGVFHIIPGVFHTKPIPELGTRSWAVYIFWCGRVVPCQSPKDFECVHVFCQPPPPLTSAHKRILSACKHLTSPPFTNKRAQGFWMCANIWRCRENKILLYMFGVRARTACHGSPHDMRPQEETRMRIRSARAARHRDRTLGPRPLRYSTELVNLGRVPGWDSKSANRSWFAILGTLQNAFYHNTFDNWSNDRVKLDSTLIRRKTSLLHSPLIK